jgi:hypothetical protein
MLSANKGRATFPKTIQNKKNYCYTSERIPCGRRFQGLADIVCEIQSTFCKEILLVWKHLGEMCASHVHTITCMRRKYS